MESKLSELVLEYENGIVILTLIKLSSSKTKSSKGLLSAMVDKSSGTKETSTGRTLGSEVLIDPLHQTKAIDYTQCVVL